MNPLVRCPHCGHYHQATLEYCPDTGLPIYITTKPEPQKDNQKLLVGLAIAAGLMALIGAIFGFLAWAILWLIRLSLRKTG